MYSQKFGEKQKACNPSGPKAVKKNKKPLKTAKFFTHLLICKYKRMTLTVMTIELVSNQSPFSFSDK